jgi:hypothetical protein
MAGGKPPLEVRKKINPDAVTFSFIVLAFVPHALFSQVVVSFRCFSVSNRLMIFTAPH